MPRNGHGAVPHDDQFKGGPADQLHDVEQHRQASKTAAVSGMHQAGAGKTAVAADFCGPGEQACAEDGAGNDDSQGRLRAECRHQVSADLHDQQTDPEAQPERRVIAPAEQAVRCGQGAARYWCLLLCWIRTPLTFPCVNGRSAC